MGRLQILEHLSDSKDALSKPKTNADGKAMERSDVLQEIGDPKKTVHASGIFREGAPTVSNNQCICAASYS
jgi:hypothetical protein